MALSILADNLHVKGKITAESMTKWIDQPCLVPFLGYVAEKDKQRFRDAVVGRMIEETIQDDGTYFETFSRINVLVRK